jgi:hypothetical protein
MLKKLAWLFLGLLTVMLLGLVYILTPPEYPDLQFPDGRDFAFAIVDDTDGATLAKIKPVYDFLTELGVICTKTVWVLPTNDTTHWPNRGETLSDVEYCAFLCDLQDRGFEIALHGARGGSSTTDEIEWSLGEFNRIFGHYPRIHINHSQNEDNMYWGPDKLSTFPLDILYDWFYYAPPSHGHDPDSKYFWGDLCKRYISYVVNFSFEEINTFGINPLIPYHDKAKPYVNYWFHSSDGGTVTSFSRLISRENVDRLEREHGVCFVYTHLASGFFEDGRIDPVFEERMKYLASKNCWFAPASDVLDFLRASRESDDPISYRHRVYIELRWILEKALHGSR